LVFERFIGGEVHVDSNAFAPERLKNKGFYEVPLRIAGHQCWLTLPKSVEHYPDRLRRISYRDPEDGKALVFLTNNFDLPALTIAQLYKGRWGVELFFKWVKQNLRIKHFFGTTENAVKTQVWIAISVYVLVAIVRKELGLELSMSQILQILSVNVFEQVPLAELVTKTGLQNGTDDVRNQLVFNGF
jgi:hypothetical protein